MNVFSAFTFGSLIKTFLPGLVWLIAIGILEADAQRLLGASPVIWPAVQAHEQAALVLAFPASILLGLLSNILVFMGVNDWLVRNRARSVDSDLFEVHDHLKARVLDRYWPLAESSDERLHELFNRHIDVELIMLNVLGPETIAYVREQYWYHLEFQINLLLSLLVAFIALMLNAFLNFTTCSILMLNVLEYLGLLAPVCLLLLVAARRNYRRHIAKIASLMAATLRVTAPRIAED
jgi:hypothetical protein